MTRFPCRRRPLIALVARTALVALLAAGLVTASEPSTSALASSQPDPALAATAIAAGDQHTCALLDTGAVRCWGQAGVGSAKLGYGNPDPIGDDETPADAGDVPLGATATAIAAGHDHTCALLETGAVRCWGEGGSGQLGYGNPDDIGNDETPAEVGDVPLGGSAIAIAAGGDHSCAIMTTNSVRCWGENSSGQLGYGYELRIGDNETVADLPVKDVSIAGEAVAITAGEAHTCVVLGGASEGQARCWGENGSGQLGIATTVDLGDDELPSVRSTIPLGAEVTEIAAGGEHTCAVTTSSSVRCWGANFTGQLGYGHTDIVGDDEVPSEAGDIHLNAVAASVVAGEDHTCVTLVTGAVRCWGDGEAGQTGYGHGISSDIGDDETPASVGNAQIGGTALGLGAGRFHTCAVLDDATLRCWGFNANAQLGQGDLDPLLGATPDEVPLVDLGGLVRIAPPAEPEPPIATVKPNLTAKAKPKRDRKSPYKFDISGRVKGGFTASPTICGGKVTLKIKQNGRKVGPKKTTKVDNSCDYDKTMKAKSKKLRGKGKVKLTVKVIYAGHTSSAKILKGANKTVTVKAR